MKPVFEIKEISEDGLLRTPNHDFYHSYRFDSREEAVKELTDFLNEEEFREFRSVISYTIVEIYR